MRLDIYDFEIKDCFLGDQIIFQFKVKNHFNLSIKLNEDIKLVKFKYKRNPKVIEKKY